MLFILYIYIYIYIIIIFFFHFSIISINKLILVVLLEHWSLTHLFNTRKLYNVFVSTDIKFKHGKYIFACFFPFLYCDPYMLMYILLQWVCQDYIPVTFLYTWPVTLSFALNSGA